MLLMLAAVFAIIIKGSIEMGGFGNVWRIASEGSRTNFFKFAPVIDEFYNGWGFALGQITYINYTVNNQYMVQRFVVCKSEATARACIIGYLVGEFIFVCLLIMAGLTIYAYYEGCSPLVLGYTTKNDQILPYFIVDVFGHIPAIPGLLLAGLFGAALSTLSSVLNANATLVGEHFVKPFCKEMSDHTYTRVLKLIVVGFSIFTLGAAFVVPVIGDAIPVIATLNGGFQGTLLALYILGAFVPWCGPKGAVSGYVVGLAVAMVMSVGSVVFPDPTDNLSLSTAACLNQTWSNGTSTTQAAWNPTTTTSTTPEDDSSGIPSIFVLNKIWFGLLTFLVSVVVALIVTLVTGVNDTSKMDPRLIVWKIKSDFVPPEIPMTEDLQDAQTPLQDECITNEYKENGECTTERSQLNTQI